VAHSETVSVIIPSYQSGHLVDDALASVFAQTYPSALTEIIVVDDGSTDDTARRLAAYGDRIRIVRKTNGGLVSACNAGLAAAGGELITFLDADDRYEPTKIANQVRYLHDHPACPLVYCDMVVTDAGDDVIAASFFAHSRITPADGAILGVLLDHNCVPACLMVRGGAARPGWDPVPACSPCQDWPTAAANAQLGPIGYLPKPLYRYRQHAANMNLGTDAARRTSLTRAELPLRRHLLRSLDLRCATAAEIARGRLRVQFHTREVADATGEDPAGILTVSDDDQQDSREHADRARALWAAGDPAAAYRAAIRGWAADPFNAPVTAITDTLERLVCSAEDEIARADPFGDARAVRILVTAGDLLREPDLLREYAASVTATDDATLVICLAAGDDVDRVTSLVARVLAGAGSDADMLAVELPTSMLAAAARHAHRQLRAPASATPFVGLPDHLTSGQRPVRDAA
jgi:hypothetical protein